MDIYIDSGSIDEIKAAVETGLIDGVTTNPTLISKSLSGKDVTFEQALKQICTVLRTKKKNFTLSAEVTAEDAKGMIAQGIKYSKIDKNIIIKVPMTREGLIAVEEFAGMGLRTNVTLVFSANQALLAAKAGAYIISPFVGRLDDVGVNGMTVVEEIRIVFKNYGFKTKILVASVRSTDHVKAAAMVGADIATIPAKVFDQLYKHPLTDKGLQMFAKDWQEYMASKTQISSTPPSFPAMNKQM